MLSVKKISAQLNRLTGLKAKPFLLGMVSLSGRALADIPTPPSDLQISSSQSFFMMLKNLIVEEILPIALPGIEIILVIYAIWGLLTAMQSSKKSGDWGEFKTQVIYSGALIIIAGALGYFAYTLGSGISVQE